MALCNMQVQTMDYSCIVFDTAPTGHTLRLLQFPTTLQKGLSKLMSLKGMFGGMLNQLGSLFGAGGGENMQDQLLGKLEQLKVGTFADCCMHAYMHRLTDACSLAATVKAILAAEVPTSSLRCVCIHLSCN